jgi:hypothetical protein
MTPARAVEVAAVFEDSVIAVKHLTVRRAPDPRITQILLGGGALALMGALGTFIASVHQVAVLRRAHDAAVAAHQASGPFMLPSGGRWLDFVVAACLVAGTWALFLGAGRYLAARLPRGFTVGPSPRADVSAPLPADLPLVQHSDAGWLLQVSAPMRGEIAEGAAPPSPVTVPSQIAVGEGTRAFIDVGALRFIIGSTEAPSRIPTPLNIDWAQEAYIGAVGMAAGIFLGFLYLIPPDPKTLSLDPIRSDLIAHYIIKAPDVPELPSKTGKETGGGGGKAAAGRSGLAGDKKLSPDKRGGLKVRGGVDLKIGRQIAYEQASKSGVLGVLRAFEQSSIGAQWASEPTLGPDAENVMGRLDTTGPGGGFGNGGLGVFGKDTGGGGTSTTTIGVNLNGIGPYRPGSGNHYGPPGVTGLGMHKVGKVEPIATPTVLSGGGLSKDIIKRVIHFHKNEIKFCYDKRLAQKPTLGSGRVVARFLIGGNGRVLNAGVEASTLGDASVEACVAEAIRRWDFPKPSDSGVISVSYPFVMHAPGE